MKVFLTGASGYVGSVIAEKLKNNGHKVSGLARNEISEAKLRGKNIEIVRGELNDFEVLKNCGRRSRCRDSHGV